MNTSRTSTSFTILLRNTWSLYEKNVWWFVSFFLPPMVAGLLYVLSIPEEAAPLHWFDWVYVIAITILDIVCAIALLRAVRDVIRQSKHTYGDNIRYGSHRFLSYILLGLRAALYIIIRGGILLILALIGYALASTFQSATQELSVKALDPSQWSLTAATYASALIGLAGVILMIILASRLFAIYFVFVDKDAESRECIDVSLAITKGSAWRTIGNLIGIIIVIITPLILLSLIPTVLDMTEDDKRLTIAIMGGVYELFATPFAAIFGFLLYDGLRKEKGL